MHRQIQNVTIWHERGTENHEGNATGGIATLWKMAEFADRGRAKERDPADQAQ